jgi:hypothetical protein
MIEKSGYKMSVEIIQWMTLIMIGVLTEDFERLEKHK